MLEPEKTRQLPLFIDGSFVSSETSIALDVYNPGTQECIARVPFSTNSEICSVVEISQRAFESWRNTPITLRARLMMKYAELLKVRQEEIALSICNENGKTLADAKGEVWRGIEVVEQAANIPSLMMGETVGNVSNNVDAYSYLQPIGVCVGLTPFNFPAMVPLWLFPLAVASGNTFILKPSEQCPLTSNKLAEIFSEAGCPKGVFQVIHGGKPQAEALIEHKSTKAISFVGSEAVARSVYEQGAKYAKRVQAFGGAKNHLVVMPDANQDSTIKNLISASMGAAGQRCMAISVGILVGDSNKWIDKIKSEMNRISPGYWSNSDADFGPLISPEAKGRVIKLIKHGISEGADCVLNGSNYKATEYEYGNWVGPTLFINVTPDMAIYQQEIFGPVLCLMFAKDLDEAIQIVNNNPFGNGTSIFTSSGVAARKFQREIECGQVGINVAIPIPLPFFSFTGWKKSFYGDLHAYGKQAVRFYTETKTVTSRWVDEEAQVNGPIKMTIG